MSLRKISSTISLTPENGDPDPKVEHKLQGTDHGAGRNPGGQSGNPGWR